MRSLFYRLSRMSFFLLLTVHLAACGQDNWVKDVESDLYAQQGEVWGEVHFYMHTGNISLAAFHLPIHAPNTRKEIGALSLQPVLGTDYVNHVLSVLINFSELANIPRGVDPVLPNGDPIPLAMVNKSAVLAVPVGQGGARVYIHMDSSLERFAVGAAIPLNGLGNPTGQRLSGFLPIALDSHIQGLFGMFFGTTASSNGFAVFMDAQAQMNTMGLMAQSQSVRLPRTSRSAKSSVELIASEFDSKSRRKIDNHMWGLHNKKAVLRMR